MNNNTFLHDVHWEYEEEGTQNGLTMLSFTFKPYEDIRTLIECEGFSNGKLIEDTEEISQKLEDIIRFHFDIFDEKISEKKNANNNILKKSKTFPMFHYKPQSVVEKLFKVEPKKIESRFGIKISSTLSAFSCSSPEYSSSIGAYNNSHQLAKLYDVILQEMDYKTLPRAQTEIDKINYILSGKKDPKEFLLLGKAIK